MKNCTWSLLTLLTVFFLHFSVFVRSYPQDLDACCFEQSCKTYTLYTSNPEMFYSCSPIIFRHGGFEAQKGQIIDASIVSAPKQRNSREENRKIKAGEDVTGWSAGKQRQKDTDASTHDSQVFKDLLDDGNASGAVWADSACRSYDNLWYLGINGYQEYIRRKGHRNHPLTERKKHGNRIRSRTRSRVEHLFWSQLQKVGNLILRSVGKLRAYLKIGLRNLAYNLDRYNLFASGAWKQLVWTENKVQISCNG